MSTLDLKVGTVVVALQPLGTCCPMCPKPVQPGMTGVVIKEGYRATWHGTSHEFEYGPQVRFLNGTSCKVAAGEVEVRP